MFRLMQHRRGTRRQEATLAELLADEEPFMVATQDGRERYIFAQTRQQPGVDRMLDGIALLDHDRNRTFFCRRRETYFAVACAEEAQWPWHSDKFHALANRYFTACGSAQLKSEFEKLGYSFEK